MILVHRSSSSKYSYPKQTLPSNPFLLFPPMSVSVDFFLFLCFQDNLEYHCILMPQETLVKYDQTIATDVGPVSFELVLPKFVPYIITSNSISPYVATYPTQYPHFNYTYILNVLFFYSPTFCTIHHCKPNRRPVELIF
jgi:hypothetical protein